MSTKIKEGTFSDLQEITQLNKIIFQDMYESEPYSLETYKERLKNKTSYILLIKTNQEIIANSIAYIENNKLYIWILGVKKEHRNKGIASKLLDQNEAYAKKNKIKSITAKVYNVSPIMQLLHLKKGYLITDFKKGKKEKLNEVHFEKNIK